MPSPLATAIQGPQEKFPLSPASPVTGSSYPGRYGGGRFSSTAGLTPAAPATSWAGQQSGSGAPDQPPLAQAGQPGQPWQQAGQPPSQWGSSPVPAGDLPIGQLAARRGYGNTGLAGGGIAAIGAGMSGW